MSTLYIPTEAELDLLDTARRALGDNLFEFLLSGLGEPHQPPPTLHRHEHQGARAGSDLPS